ncbi:MFS transporter [Williamsia sterculiae]|uniref:MFS transporter, DHA2 family, methylenomycin A resistance protein n=1 Tax=Williamsia sterculiae TaxID=1344003 RepID=A0A1N7H2X3_9NOCA|nr:MFS transporter [Williamsia sterculiae]SIS19184.1 MFS transporter, DHA2 family, methylenomycin A resistance protein [Williamsia sterculiae]
MATRNDSIATSTPVNSARGPVRAVALIALSLTFGVVQLDATVVNVALDTIGRDLGGDLGLSQWLVEAYAVPFASLLLIGGAAADRFGHRRVCVAGFALFAFASVAAGLATGWSVLLAARVIQGVGAAAMLPASLALVGELYPERHQRARALGIWGGIATLGFAAGPLVGGALISTIGWQSIFWMNVPVALVVGGTVAITAPHDRPQDRPLDRTGSLVAAAGLAAVVAGIIAGGQGRVVATVLLVVLAAVAFVVFVGVERRTPHPLLPRSVLARPALHWTMVTGFGFNFAMYGSLLCVTLTLQKAHGFGALSGGFATVPMATIVFVGATASGALTARCGPRYPMVIGLVLGAVGTVGIGTGALLRSPGYIITGLAMCGLVSLSMPAMTSVALGAVAADRAGLAGGGLNTTRQIGGALGVAMMGAILNGLGYRYGLAVAALLATIVLAIACASAVAATREEGS